MTYPTALLIHSANLETGETLGTADAFGVSPTTKTYTVILCRFGQPRVSYPKTESGPHAIRSPVCIIPAGTVAVEGKTIVGLTVPYNRTYKILGVRAAGLSNSISHLVLDLEAVDG